VERLEAALKQVQEGLTTIIETINTVAKEKFPGRFTVLPDGWVKDNQLGIDWGPTHSKKVDWEEAKTACDKSGGRLPTVPELFSLVDRKKHDPAIVDGGEALQMKTDDWYWSSESCAWSQDGAWVVHFYSGYVSNGYKGRDGCVRPVRSSK
jgi:hypothetical protein